MFDMLQKRGKRKLETNHSLVSNILLECHKLNPIKWANDGDFLCQMGIFKNYF